MAKLKKCLCCSGTGGMTIMKSVGEVIKVVYPYRTTCDQCDGSGAIEIITNEFSATDKYSPTSMTLGEMYSSGGL